MSTFWFFIGTQVGLLVGLFWAGRRRERESNLMHEGYSEADREMFL